MAQFPAEDIATFYGTTTIQRCIKTGGVVPIQVMGLIPCRKHISKFGCNEWNNIVNVPVFSDKPSYFFFQYPTTDGTEQFRLEKFTITSEINNYVDASLNQYVDQGVNDYVDSLSGASMDWQFVDTNIGDGILDDTEGTLYPLNGGFPNHLEYAGFCLDWNYIYTTYGEGTYRFSAYDAVTPSNSLYSPTMVLKEATDVNKDGTVSFTMDQRGLYDNPFFGRNNGEQRQWDAQNFDSTVFPSGWIDCAYYYGQLRPVENENVTAFVKKRNNERKLQFSDTTNNFDLHLFKMDYQLAQRLLHYGKNSYNIRISDCNNDSQFANMNNMNVVFKKDQGYDADVIPNNRELLSVKFMLEQENQFNYRP